MSNPEENSQDDDQNATGSHTESPETAGTPAAPAAPEPAVTPAATTPTPVPEARPLPEFGEYAPEGWEWKPEEHAASAAHGTGLGTQQGSTPANGISGTVPGVPHNLGVGATLPKKGAKPSSSGAHRTGGAPYVGEAPKQNGRRAHQEQPQPGQSHQAPTHPQAQQQLAHGAAAAGAATAQAKRPNMADRIITTILLALGALGALQTAFAMFSITMTFNLLGNIEGVTPFTAPSWLEPTGKVAGVAILTLYALTLVYSIRRIRARKLAFWAPLVCAAIVFLAVFVITLAAMMSTPELMQTLTDPAQSAALFEYLQSQPLS